VVLNGWLPNGVFMGLGMGLLLGVSVLTAELNGSGRGEETGRVFWRGVGVSVLYSAVATLIVVVIAEPLLRLFGFETAFVTAAGEATRILAYGTLAHMIGMAATYYLEALRRPNIVTAISMTAVIFNLVMDLVLVPQYGAAGVAWATTASRYLIAILGLVAVLALTPAGRIFSRRIAGPAGEFARQFQVGLGTGVANVAEWGAFNMTFVIATLVSNDAGTVYGLAVQFMGVIFMIYMGMGTATSVRVAERFGRGDTIGVREASRLGVVASLIVGGTLALLLWTFRDAVAVVSLNAGENVEEGARLVPLLSALLAAAAVVTIFDGLQGVGAMALRAQNVVWTPTVIHVGSYIVVMLPLAAWAGLATDLGVWGVMLGVAAASVLAGAGQVFVLEWVGARRARPQALRTVPAPQG
jgi:multidrug resistance protein, MATE family